MQQKTVWVIGVDEAGRGPLAGPISVGAVAIPLHMNEWETWDGLKDSKQLSEKKREEWFAILHTHEVARTGVAMVSASVIDKEGITRAATKAAARAIAALELSPDEAHVLLDRGLRAPDAWQQEQFTKGDATIPVIALASVMAKVTRDRHMVRAGKKHAGYGFEIHKGYGTKAHCDAIRTLGPIDGMHRALFIRNILQQASS